MENKQHILLEKLDEFVVVGYGVQRKRELTGSIVKLSTKDITDIPAPSFENAIQGKAAGVQVVTGSGLAGSGSVIRIRGISSISAGGDPLYVIDGIPITDNYFVKGNSGAMNNNPLSSLNPNDIESVEILKDAASTGIYGSRGANGVILITTKRGKDAKKLKFTYSNLVGIARPTRLPNMLNSQQYLQLYEEAWVNDGNTGVPTLPGGISWEDAQNTNTNWVDQTVGTGFKHRHDLAVQKGTEKYNFYTGFSFDKNESYLIGNSYERMSGRINGDVKLLKNLDLSLSTSLSRGTNNRIDAAWSGGLGSAMSTALPIYPVYNDDGTFFNGGSNPVRQRELKTWRNRELRSINNINLTFKPIKNLFFNFSGGYDYMQITEDIFEDPQLLNLTSADGGKAQRYPTKVNNYNGFATANYIYDVNKNNKLNKVPSICLTLLTAFVVL